MSHVVVQDILKLIDDLSDADRELLEQQLIQREESQWRSEVAAARCEAKQRGIDQAAIDAAVLNLRRRGAIGRCRGNHAGVNGKGHLQ